MKPAHKRDKFIIRMPDGLRDEIARMADEGYRTMNAQILMMIDQAVQAEKAKKTAPEHQA